MRASAAPAAGSRSRATTSCPTSSPSPRASTPATCRSAASIISDAISATFDDRVFPGGLTYSGHPLAAASIVASIDAMEAEGIVENARRIGADVIGPGLADLAERHPLIGEVRGEGVFWAIELVADRETREPVGADVIGRLKKELSCARPRCRSPPTTASTWCRRASSPTTRSPRRWRFTMKRLTSVEAAH